MDTTPPVCVGLPEDIVEEIELGGFGTIVSWIEPTCDDLSGTAQVSLRSSVPGSFFQAGETIVTYTCVDSSSNEGTCSFTVTVLAGESEFNAIEVQHSLFVSIHQTDFKYLRFPTFFIFDFQFDI